MVKVKQDYEQEIVKLKEEIHKINVYYLREIQRMADELKQADKNYIALKNEFDTRLGQ